MADLASLPRPSFQSPSYARYGVKASHACQNHGRFLPNYCQFITPKRSQPRPFPAPIWRDYSDVAPVCQNSSPTVCLHAGVTISSLYCKSTPK
ncbi:hypothetical protein OAJ39_00430 [Alphaproteobacteria bacterium]|nr:hypothetical protein [Alphaproteobacteria bacterium]